MAGISIEMQMVMYVILIVALGFAGYYVGQMYKYDMAGAIAGVVLGIIISGLLYKFVLDDSPSYRLAAGY